MSRQPFQKFVVNYSPGDSIYTEGEAGATMYIVQSGRVRLFRNKNEDAHTLGLMEKGDFFGEMSILEGLPRASSAQAMEESELIEINSSTFDKMIKGNIEIAIRLLRKLSIRLRDAERQVVALSSESHATASPARQAVASRAAASPAVENGTRLELEEGEVVFPVREAETMVGRYDPVTELKPDVDLTELDLKRSVSRRHARLVRTGDRFALIEEVGALNGTKVNDAELVTGEPHAVGSGDVLTFGMVRLVFRT